MHNKQILYIEDHPLNAEILRHIARKLWGIEIDIAPTAEEGFIKLASGNYDLIYMDIHLPGMTGLEAISHIKSSNTLPSPPIIAVTADASPSTQEEVKKAGGDGFIAKPIDVQVLRESTEALLGA